MTLKFSRRFAVVCSVIFLASACAGGGDSAPSTEGATTVADTAVPSTDTPIDIAPAASCEGELTASMPGVTADEIRIGAVAQDTARLADIGLGIDLGDIEETFGVFVDEVNAAGGICGRTLVLDNVTLWNVLTDGADQEACLKVTQDVELAAVFSTAGWPSAAARCVAAAGGRIHIVDYSYDTSVFEDSEGRLFTFGPTADDILIAMVDYADTAGLLNGTVGVLYGTDIPDEGDLVDAVVVPALEAAGVTPELCRMSMSAGGSNGSTEVNLCIEQFKNAGVTTVIVGTDLLSMLLGRIEATTTGFEATWLGSTYPMNTNINAGPILIKSFGGTAAMDGQLGLTPVGDFENSPESASDCVDSWTAATGKTPANVAQVATIANICTMVRQYASAMAAAGANPTEADVVAALEGVGRFTLPSGVEGEWSADTHAAGLDMRVVRFSTANEAYEEVRGFEPLTK